MFTKEEIVAMRRAITVRIVDLGRLKPSYSFQEEIDTLKACNTRLADKQADINFK